jgi:glycine/sarcosine N-methyltransferase
LSTDYDRFVDWPSRLRVEMPFIEAQLASVNAHKVLDVACGTGAHAIALAGDGYEVVGSDLSSGMIARARQIASDQNAKVRFVVAGFEQTREVVGEGFDAILCLGNSLPHVLTAAALQEALVDWVQCLRPGGILLIQSRNFDNVVRREDRWMEPQSHRDGPQEWVFLRFYDFLPDGLLSFNVVTLKRGSSASWQQKVSSTLVRPIGRDELLTHLATAGFANVQLWGDMQSHPFDVAASPNLVVLAHRTQNSNR